MYIRESVEWTNRYLSTQCLNYKQMFSTKTASLSVSLCQCTVPLRHSVQSFCPVMERKCCHVVWAAYCSGLHLSLVCILDGNQCISNPCVNGTCVDLYQSYACRCNLGFEGKDCDQREPLTPLCLIRLHLRCSWLLSVCCVAFSVINFLFSNIWETNINMCLSCLWCETSFLICVFCLGEYLLRLWFWFCSLCQCFFVFWLWYGLLCLASTATNCAIANGGCDHECQNHKDGLRRTCSCVQGYRLHQNSRHCVPEGKNYSGALFRNNPGYAWLFSVVQGILLKRDNIYVGDCLTCKYVL